MHQFYSDLELDVDIEADLQRLSPAPPSPTAIKTEEPLLVADETVDRFEALPRPSALFLHGVDDMSTDDIMAYVNTPLVTKVEWINDSSCNLVCATPDDALAVASALLPMPQELDHRTLVPVKPFIKTIDNDDQNITNALFVRISTDEDVKERGARERSRYYMLYGSKDQPVTAERAEARREHLQRMQKNGGDGRDVFSRLGNKATPSSRSRSRSPERNSGRITHSRNRDIPDRLKSRLGPIKHEACVKTEQDEPVKQEEQGQVAAVECKTEE